MATENNKILPRIYLVAFTILAMAVIIVYKLTVIQWTEGDYYRKLAREKTVKDFIVPANKGNIYSADGNLLATSVPNYSVRFDAIAPKRITFERNVKALADSLGIFTNTPTEQIEKKLRRARLDKNRYMFVIQGLSYSEYMRFKKFPLFKLGSNKGGFIVEQKTVRKYPMGMAAKRMIGYERYNPQGVREGKGIEWAYQEYLNGKNGRMLKQKIAKGQWKPINDNNEVEPKDGLDIITTLDINIQDIAHHALLKQLEEYKADHGCVVVMETKTGHIKAISNLGIDEIEGYYETTNYAYAESHEPGSTFKLIGLMALLEDKKADTSTVYNTFDGEVKFADRIVRDSHKDGYGKISLARGFELSSNTVFAQAVNNAYKNFPSEFINNINKFGLNKRLNLALQGEGKPFFPQPGTKSWSRVTLPWMAFGYGVSMTPMQTLTFYNAVANDGIMVKPQIVSEIKEWDNTVKKIKPEVINKRICSQETISKLKIVLENVIKKGTGAKLYSENFSMAGKTGTTQLNYSNRGTEKMNYVSSFVGYFPATNPKYSCIVVINQPSTGGGNYYGVDVAGPVFKKIAEKIYTNYPRVFYVNNLNIKTEKINKDYNKYYIKLLDNKKLVPNVKGMAGMDAVALLENLGLNVKIKGSGIVRNQSVQAGENIQKNSVIILELS